MKQPLFIDPQKKPFLANSRSQNLSPVFSAPYLLKKLPNSPTYANPTASLNVSPQNKNKTTYSLVSIDTIRKKQTKKPLKIFKQSDQTISKENKFAPPALNFSQLPINNSQRVLVNVSQFRDDEGPASTSRQLSKVNVVSLNNQARVRSSSPDNKKSKEPFQKKFNKKYDHFRRTQTNALGQYLGKFKSLAEIKLKSNVINIIPTMNRTNSEWDQQFGKTFIQQEKERERETAMNWNLDKKSKEFIRLKRKILDGEIVEIPKEYFKKEQDIIKRKLEGSLTERPTTTTAEPVHIYSISRQKSQEEIPKPPPPQKNVEKPQPQPQPQPAHRVKVAHRRGVSMFDKRIVSQKEKYDNSVYVGKFNNSCQNSVTHSPRQKKDQPKGKETEKLGLEGKNMIPTTNIGDFKSEFEKNFLKAFLKPPTQQKKKRPKLAVFGIGSGSVSDRLPESKVNSLNFLESSPLPVLSPKNNIPLLSQSKNWESIVLGKIEDEPDHVFEQLRSSFNSKTKREEALESRSKELDELQTKEKFRMGTGISRRRKLTKKEEVEEVKADPVLDFKLEGWN